MSKPTVQRLTYLSKDEKAARNIYCSLLNKIEMTADLAVDEGREAGIVR